jgi:hypothetical protein
MPTIEIEALDWSYSHDLDDAGSAAEFRATYRQQTAARVWDPNVHEDLAPYGGAAAPDLVAIIVTTDGLRRELVTGVVDEKGWRQDDSGVIGEVVGRDRMALLLDRRPAAGFTLQGTQYDPDTGSLVYGESFMSAVQQVCSRAGVAVQFRGNVVNYWLGDSVVVSPQQTYAQVIAPLLGPLRWSERHRVDAWMEGPTLIIAARSASAEVVQVEAARIDDARMAESVALPGSPADAPAGEPGQPGGPGMGAAPKPKVRVEGYKYQREVPDIGGEAAPNAETYENAGGEETLEEIWYTEPGEDPDDPEGGKPTNESPTQRREAKGKPPKQPIPGLPWSASYVWHVPERTVTQTVQGLTESYTVKETEYYDWQGRLTRRYRQVIYQSKNRTETTNVVNEFVESQGPSYGHKKAEHETYYVKAVAYDASGKLITDIDEVVREKKTEWTYWFDTGDTLTMDSLSVEKDEGAQKSPLPLLKQEITRQRFRRSLGQVWRETEVITSDEQGFVSRSFEVSEVGPLRIEWQSHIPQKKPEDETQPPEGAPPDWQPGDAAPGLPTPGGWSVASPGKTMQAVQVVARPGDNAMPGDEEYTFSSGLIGDAGSAAAIRDQILDDWIALPPGWQEGDPIRLRANIALVLKPDVRIRPGRTLQVLNADSWWWASSIYLTSVRASHGAGVMRMDVQGVAWPP